MAGAISAIPRCGRLRQRYGPTCDPLLCVPGEPLPQHDGGPSDGGNTSAPGGGCRSAPGSLFAPLLALGVRYRRLRPR